MKISIESPIMLIFIPLIIFLIIFFGKNIKFYSNFKRNFFIFIRSIICILLILSISNIKVLNTVDNISTIFAIDMSASSKNFLSDYKQIFIDAQKYKKNNMYEGAIIFGSNSITEKNIDKNNFDWDLKSYVLDSSTNIENALRFSTSLFNNNTSKRIVLISDGNENVGDAIKQANILKSKNIVVDSYIPEININDEVQITSINVDKYINKNINYTVNIVIDSLSDTYSNLKLYKDNILIYNDKVSINKGNNKFIINDISDKGGQVIYKAVLEPDVDTYYENNQMYESCYIEDVPSVLILEQNDSGRELEKILSASKLDVTVVNSKSAPYTIEQLKKYDSIIIADVNIKDIPEQFLDSIDTYVKNIGGGLLVTSGENSLALGGYFGTKLEKILPIDMQIKTEGENPDLGIVFVIDNSGSMSESNYGVSKIEMAKEALIRSVTTLNKIDKIGILAFDHEYEWVWNSSILGDNVNSIINSVSKIQPDGGTSILPALEQAYLDLKYADTKMKHIILLTDGQAENTGYDKLIQNMNNDKITLSTVAVGDDADTNLLMNLAEKSNGRYYFTNAFTDLPKIFVNEIFLAGKEYINNSSFYPKLASNSEILDSVSELPKLHGYISSTIKNGADIILETNKKEPLLATWQYGIGRTAVWTSDFNGKWTSDWILSENGLDVLRNTISWIMKKKIFDEVRASASVDGEKIRVKLEVPFGKYDLKGKIISFDNNEYDIEFEAVSSGILEGYFPDIREGSYIMNLYEKDDNTNYLNTSFNIHYPLEYDITKINNGNNLIKKITDITGGKIISSSLDVYREIENNSYAYESTNNIFIILALILFIIDIFIRRFHFIFDKIECIYNQISISIADKGIKIDSKSIKNFEEQKQVKKLKTDENHKHMSENLLKNKNKRYK